MPTRFTEQSQRFRPNSKEEQVVQKAQEHFEKTLVNIQNQLAGSVAALEHRHSDEALNYGEIFLRDNVPVMIYLLLQGRFAVVKHFLKVCLDLQSTSVQTRGVFPTSFVEENGELVADYGQRSIGRITSVDASPGGHSLLDLCEPQWRFRVRQKSRGAKACNSCWIWCFIQVWKARRCVVPDCAFMIDRPMDVWGAPLEVEVLLFAALRTLNSWRSACAMTAVPCCWKAARAGGPMIFVNIFSSTTGSQARPCRCCGDDQQNNMEKTNTKTSSMCNHR